MAEAALTATAGATLTASVETPTARAIRRFKRRKGPLLALAVIAIFVSAAALAPLISPYDPDMQTWTAVRKAPSVLHWFGTDDVGRDVLARVIFGARASLLAGVISVAIAMLVGVPVGLISGYLGGFVDALFSRITDALLACPFLILAIAFAAFLGPSLGNAMIAIGITTTPIFIRLTRGQVMAVKVEDYVEAARAVGYHCRGRIVVSRPRATTAGAVMGQHAQCRAAISRQRAVDGDLAGPGNLFDSAVVQSGRGRSARRARSALAVIRSRSARENSFEYASTGGDRWSCGRAPAAHDPKVLVHAVHKYRLLFLLFRSCCARIDFTGIEAATKELFESHGAVCWRLGGRGGESPQISHCRSLSFTRHIGVWNVCSRFARVL
jgi:ABC-type nitrate/sulfonate/bicarbonate transport system permease component